MKSYRRTHKNNPLSNWDSAMFADNFISISESYGTYLWYVKSEDLTNIYDLKNDLIKLYKKLIRNKILSLETKLEKFLNGFDPNDIVESAGNYDWWDTVEGLFEICDKKDIQGVKTSSGAFVFDKSIIHKTTLIEINSEIY